MITPHPGEAARLLGISTQAVQADRPAAARALADKFDAVCVLKGTGSLIADVDGRLALVQLTTFSSRPAYMTERSIAITSQVISMRSFLAYNGRYEYNATTISWSFAARMASTPPDEPA